MPDITNKPVINDVSAPTIEKHSTTMTSNVPSEDNNPKPAQIISTNGTTITPDASASQPDVADANQGVNASDSPDQATQPEPNQPSTGTAPESPYEASDSLPDLSQKLTTEMTNEMQSPRIYDTKEYVVPIHDTVHGHGTIGKIVAALVSVAVVLAIVVAIAYAVI